MRSITKRVTKYRRMRWLGHMACERETRNLHRGLGRKPEGKRPLWRPSGRCEGTDGINVGQNMHMWQVVGDMEMNTLWTRPVPPSLPPNSPHLTLSGLHLSWSICQYTAGKQLQYMAKSQPSPPGHRHLPTLIPSTLGYNPQCSSGTNA